MADKENKKNKKKNQEPEQAPAPEPREGQAEGAAQPPGLPRLHGELGAGDGGHPPLPAEYDNFRKRTQKEKDASYANGKADTLVKLLPVYDNLERALNQPTEDAAYKKGVEMTMAELEKIFQGLGAESFGAPGDAFDPNLHNAVMHTADESLGESTIVQVFQKGFRVGEKVIRFAMVQVAN